MNRPDVFPYGTDEIEQVGTDDNGGVVVPDLPPMNVTTRKPLPEALGDGTTIDVTGLDENIEVVATDAAVDEVTAAIMSARSGN